MLQLNDSLIIGEGAHRRCYLHPYDREKCIKIVKDSNDIVQILENKYYAKLEKSNILWKHLSRRFGTVETNLGIGNVFELVSDFDENISLSISHYLGIKDNSEMNSEVIHKALTELKYFLCENKIIVRNLRPYNMLFKRINCQDGHIVIIDNIGHHKNRFHLTDHVHFLAKKNLLRKWQMFSEYYLNFES